jgi:hypothetical protein
MATERGSSEGQAPFGVRVRANARGGATAYARAHSFEVGSALPFDLEEPRLAAIEYLLGALGGDLIGGFRALARKRRLAIDDVEATVEATLVNALTHLGVVGEEGHPGIERVTIRVHVAAFAPGVEVQAVWDEAARRSPLLRTIEAAARVEVTLELTV